MVSDTDTALSCCVGCKRHGVLDRLAAWDLVVTLPCVTLRADCVVVIVRCIANLAGNEDSCDIGQSIFENVVSS